MHSHNRAFSAAALKYVSAPAMRSALKNAHSLARAHPRVSDLNACLDLICAIAFKRSLHAIFWARARALATVLCCTCLRRAGRVGNNRRRWLTLSSIFFGTQLIEVSGSDLLIHLQKQLNLFLADFESLFLVRSSGPRPMSEISRSIGFRSS